MVRDWIGLGVIVFFLMVFNSPLGLLGGEPVLKKTVLFEAKQDGVELYRIPGMVVTPKGTLLTYVEARVNSGGDWGEIEVHGRRSLDQGKTWLKAQKIAHQGTRLEGNPRKKSGGEHEQTVNNPIAVCDHTTGKIEFLYCINYARCYSMHSSDDGETYSEPVDITSTFEPFRKHYDWNVIATGPGHGIQLKSGRLLVPIWLAYGKNPGDHSPSACGTIYSDDHGKSWKAGDISVHNTGEFYNPNESMITELSDGRVLMVTRSVSKPNRKILTYSADGISQWSQPEFHVELPEPVCMASIITLPGEKGILFSNPDRVGVDKNGKEIPAGRGKRENLSIRLSRDLGKTWPIKKTLEAGPSAYSDFAIGADGQIFCLYEGNKNITIARFNLEWLTSP